MQKVLYISYDGMTDPLGQSQVIPYLAGLSKKGISFHLVSFEKKERYAVYKGEIEKLLSLDNIQWHPLIYTKNPPILSTVYDLMRLNALCKKLYRIYNFKVVHCRSYISSLTGLRLQKKYSIKFIFDMRGFYADERVDGGLWPQNNFIYKKIYQYFKKKEQQYIHSADYIISLTEKGKTVMEDWNPQRSLPIQVIPCCVDLEKFDRSKISPEQTQQLKKKLKINESQKIISYVGSISTWYLPNEMMAFFKRFLLQYGDAVFLFITAETEQTIFSFAKNQGINSENIKVIKGMHHEVPSLLSLSDYSIFFVKPAFSKNGSSPTKMGEIMAMGIPLICNSGVGDVETITKDTQCGVLLHELNDSTFDSAISNITSSVYNPETLRSGAIKYYSLKKGIELYWEVYQKLLNIIGK